MTPHARTPRDLLVVPIALAVTAAWLGALVIGMFQGSFIALEVTTPVMLVVAGYVFGVQIVRGTRADGNNETR